MTTLRQRIIAKMPVILELIANERRPRGMGGDHDFWPEIIASIQRIADLEMMPPSQARRAFDKVAKDVRRLRLSLAKLPPSARHRLEAEVSGLDGALSQVKNETGTGRTATVRKRLAAEVAHDLILDYGSVVPTLTKDEPYIELANLLYFVATGKKGDLKKHCGQRLNNLKAEGFNFYSPRRGPRGKTELPAHLIEYVAKGYAAADAAKELQRRKAAIKKWPPLKQVVDKALGHSK